MTPILVPPAPLPSAPATRTIRKPALPALTGLRTILAVTIMLFHFTPPHIGLIRPLVDNGFVFVGFFFLISGFVLAYNYADRPTLAKRAFYIARLSRVYPVYLLVLILSIPFLWQEWPAHSPQDFYRGLILTPLALQGWSPSLATFWNTVAWTLPAEIALYAAFPFLLLWLAKHSRHIATPTRLILAIALAWVLGLLPHILYLIFNPDHITGPIDRYSYGYWLRAIKYTPPFYFFTFLAGVLLARLHGALPLTPRQRGTLAFTAVLALGLFFAFGVNHTPYLLLHGTLLLPLFAALLLGLCGPNPIASILSVRPLVLFGETTFALYLLHFNGIEMIHLYHLPERLHVAALDPWISYAAIIALAFAVCRFYEQPARRFVLSFSTPRQ